jgi:hypothetical protein
MGNPNELTDQDWLDYFAQPAYDRTVEVVVLRPSSENHLNDTVITALGGCAVRYRGNTTPYPDLAMFFCTPITLSHSCERREAAVSVSV